MYKGLNSCGEQNCFNLFVLAKLKQEDEKYIQPVNFLPFSNLSFQKIAYDFTMSSFDYDFWCLSA